jgi:hypothetical protein
MRSGRRCCRTFGSHQRGGSSVTPHAEWVFGVRSRWCSLAASLEPGEAALILSGSIWRRALQIADVLCAASARRDGKLPQEIAQKHGILRRESRAGE